MRTKTLLLTAALSAAGVATSMAQVYSVNAVGYVNTTLAPGFNLISNPLVAQNNTIKSLFADAGAAAAAAGGTLQVYKYVNGSYLIAAYDDLDGTFGPEPDASATVLPGEGVFVRNPGSAPLTVTFVGEVMQGTAAAPLNNPLPAGLSIRSSMVPQAGTATALGLVGEPSDQFYQFVPGSGYVISLFDDLEEPPAWVPALQPLKVGEAFFLRKVNAATWTRVFTVNQ